MLNFFLKTLSVATLNIATSPFVAMFLCFGIFFCRKSKILRLLLVSTACYGSCVFLPPLMSQKELATAEISPPIQSNTKKSEEAATPSLEPAPTAEEATLSVESAPTAEESKEVNGEEAAREAEEELEEKTPPKKGFFRKLLGGLPFFKSPQADQERENPGIQIPLEKNTEAATKNPKQAIGGTNGEKKLLISYLCY